MVWLSLLPRAGGAGLVAYILAGVSLLLGIGLAATAGLVAAWSVWYRMPAATRPWIKRQVKAGMIAGLWATVGCDLSRYAFVKLTGITFWPFHVFSIFGQLLIGVKASVYLGEIIGVLYHLCNSIGFAIGFVFLFRRPGILTGILWAAILELFMISLYLSWLHLKALDELLSVSILGHAVYGTVLGVSARRGLREV